LAYEIREKNNDALHIAGTPDSRLFHFYITVFTPLTAAQRRQYSHTAQ
jgi:hypothetical protein